MPVIAVINAEMVGISTVILLAGIMSIDTPWFIDGASEWQNTRHHAAPASAAASSRWWSI
jgi:ABC-type polysaccharide transport system permease subunit